MIKNKSRLDLDFTEQGLTQIASLCIPNNIVKKIQVLLNLHGNCLDEDQEELTRFNYLKTLDLSLNHIISLYSLPENLEVLNLSCNHIQDLKPLSGLARLKKLDLSCNLVSDPSPLTSIKTLTTLLIGYNLITNLGFLINFTGLVEIDLEHNKLCELDAVIPLVQSQVIVFILKSNPVIM